MAGKESDGRFFLSADADGLAVAAIFWGENELLLKAVEIAFGPTEIGAFREFDHFFRRQLMALLRRIEMRPVLIELIAAVLRIEETPRCIEGKALAIAQTCRVTLRRREQLAGLVRIIAPDAATRFEFCAGLLAGRARSCD